MSASNDNISFIDDRGNLLASSFNNATVVQIATWIYERLARNSDPNVPWDPEVVNRPHGIITDNFELLGRSGRENLYLGLLRCLADVEGSGKGGWLKDNGISYLFYTIGCVFEKCELSDIRLQCLFKLKDLALRNWTGYDLANEAANAIVLMGGPVDEGFWASFYQRSEMPYRVRAGAISIAGMAQISPIKMLEWLKLQEPPLESLRIMINPLFVMIQRNQHDLDAFCEGLRAIYSTLPNGYYEVIEQTFFDFSKGDLLAAISSTSCAESKEGSSKALEREQETAALFPSSVVRTHFMAQSRLL